jgi:uncharacterized membrane protein
MATKGTNQKDRKANPMFTKTGKPRLGPLNVEQLTKLLSDSRKKNKPKIQRAIVARQKV